MTTPPIQTLTDELLEEIESDAEWHNSGATVQHTLGMLTELRTLRAENAEYSELLERHGKLQMTSALISKERDALRVENAELRKDAERYRWLSSRKSLSLESSASSWERNGVRFVTTHRLCAGDTAHAPHPSLNETIDTAMEQAK